MGKTGIILGSALTVFVLLLMSANINKNATPAIYQDVFTYTKNATTNDTTGWYSLGGANIIEFSQYYGGSASSTITTYILGKFSDGAEKLLYTSSARTTAAITHINLRQLDSSLIGAVEQVKIATKVVNGAADSTGLLKSYMSLLCR